MPCKPDHYQLALLWMIEQSANGKSFIAQQVGSDLLALIIIAVLMVPVTALFGYAGKVLIPKFVKWYYGKTIAEKALEWWRRNGLGFLGFKHSTAIISIATGLAFYFLIRIAANLPTYYWITIPALLVVFVGVAFLGYFVSGNVPDDDGTRNKYFKRFHQPTVTGLGLGVATIILDFIIHAATLALTWIQSA